MNEKKIPMVFYWYGKPCSELSREELLEVIEHLASESGQLRADRDRWMEAGDPAKYLLGKRR